MAAVAVIVGIAGRVPEQSLRGLMPVDHPSKPTRYGGASCLLAGLTAVALIGCDGGGAARPTQVVAKVNKEELTIHQVNYLLARSRGTGVGAADEKARVALESLIDQSLAVQQAKALDLDHDPDVLREIDFARREVLARAYARYVSSPAAPVTAEQVRSYFMANPLLFADRRVFELEDWSIALPLSRRSEVEERVREEPFDEVTRRLRAEGVTATSTLVVRSAEQLPLRMLPALSAARPGQAFVVPSDGPLRIVVVRGSKLEPVSEDEAKASIEQFLINEARRALLAADAKALRTSAKLEYVGAFAHKSGASAEAAPGASTAASAAIKAASGAGLGNIR